MSQGEILETLLSIKSGYIKVSSLDDMGVERLLWIAGRSDMVPGEHFFSSNTRLSFFYTALTEVTAYSVNRKDFLAYTRSHPDVMADIATNMSNYYDDLLLRIDSIDQTNIHDKLIATLHYLARRFSETSSIDLHAIGLPLTHQDIAEMIGSTRETASLELHKLRDDGHIDYDRSHFVIYRDKFETKMDF